MPLKGNFVLISGLASQARLICVQFSDFTQKLVGLIANLAPFKVKCVWVIQSFSMSFSFTCLPKAYHHPRYHRH